MKTTNNSDTKIIIFAAIVICVAICAFFFMKKDNKPVERKVTPVPTEKTNLDDEDVSDEDDFESAIVSEDDQNFTSLPNNLSVSTTNLVIKKGETASFDIALVNAVGRIDVIPTDEDIANVTEKNIWLESVSDEEDRKTIFVTGVEVGNTTISIELEDVAVFDTEEQLSGSTTINVTVE